MRLDVINLRDTYGCPFFSFDASEADSRGFIIQDDTLYLKQSKPLKWANKKVCTHTNCLPSFGCLYGCPKNKDKKKKFQKPHKYKASKTPLPVDRGIEPFIKTIKIA